MATEFPKCDVCPQTGSYGRKDCTGRKHYACVDHAKYLEGWCRDVASEVNSESRAAARYEAAAYGDDE